MAKWMVPFMAATALAACTQEGGSDTAAAEEATAEAPAESGEAASAEPVLTAEGYGPLRIGMTLDEVNAALGPDDDPDAIGGPEPEMCDQFHPENAPDGMIVMIEQGVLTSISLGEGSPVETSEGLSVGDAASAVRAAYGDRIRQMPHTYVDPPGEYLTVWTRGETDEPYTDNPDARGIRYEIGMDGNVEIIHAGGPSIQYVEGCL